MWSLGVAASTAIVAFSSPVLGVIADRTSIKKTLLWSYTAAGALFTFLSFFSAYTGAAWAWVLGCFLVANVGFAGGNVFYNAFLPHLAPKGLLDDISSRGYAYGYVGGGLLLAIHLVFIIGFRETAHIDLVTRGAIASVGVWWFGWAIWTFKTVPEPHIPNPLEGLTVGRATRIAVSELQRTLRELTRFRVLVVYLVAYLLFNDGIQTVLVVAGAFGAETLGVSLEFNMGTVLIVQFVAAVGAMLFSWLAGRLGTKKALGLALLGWCMVITLRSASLHCIRRRTRSSITAWSISVVVSTSWWRRQTPPKGTATLSGTRPSGTCGTTRLLAGRAQQSWPMPSGPPFTPGSASRSAADRWAPPSASAHTTRPTYRALWTCGPAPCASSSGSR